MAASSSSCAPSRYGALSACAASVSSTCAHASSYSVTPSSDPLLVGEPVRQRRHVVLAGADALRRVLAARGSRRPGPPRRWRRRPASPPRPRPAGGGGAASPAISLSITDCGRDMVLCESMQPPAGDDVGPGGADRRGLHRLLVARLHAGVLGVGREPGVQRRHAEVVADLGGHGAHQRALDGARARRWCAACRARPSRSRRRARAPGAATCSAVATPRNSATPCTTVPASVTGDVAPAMAIE